ncbi:hypothetical protein ACQCVB_20335 [Fictibacillus phosphorivorans]|uniref:hypothetical protein n=1 Tax=Fictibacillus phosphorivorans TaxID=1221500 RepID=UPI003CEDEA3E
MVYKKWNKFVHGTTIVMVAKYFTQRFIIKKDLNKGQPLENIFLKKEEKVFEISDKYKAAFLKKPIQDLLPRLYYDLHRNCAINTLDQKEIKKYKNEKNEWIEHKLVGRAIEKSPILKAMIHREKHQGYNVSVAFLQDSIVNNKMDQSMRYYIAFNEGTEQRLSNAEKKIIEENKIKLNFCSKSEVLDVIRLKVENLDTYIPKSKGVFASRKQNCAEKKILSKIYEELLEIKDNQHYKGKLFIYTKLEPCIYCVNAIEDFTNKTGIKVYIVYEELIYELIRENFIKDTDKFKAIINVISPSEYETIKEYDHELANRLKKSIELRRPNLSIEENKHEFKFYY